MRFDSLGRFRFVSEVSIRVERISNRCFVTAKKVGLETNGTDLVAYLTGAKVVPTRPIESRRSSFKNLPDKCLLIVRC